MAILFSISILAFCALLWASISVARHLRRAAHHKERGHSERDQTAGHSRRILRDSH